MKVSKKGLLEIAKHEAIVRSPYLDAGNVWTIGLGHTAAAGSINPAKLNKSKRYSYRYLWDLFKHDIQKYEARVNKYITVPLTQEQFDALVSFDYNTGAIGRSTATRYINAGKSKIAIGAALMMWVRVGGKKNKGLIRRRMGEVKLFTKGVYSGDGTTLEYQTNGRGRILWKSAAKINLKKLL